VRLLVTFWRWCGKPPREWCKADALSHIERAETVSGAIGTLTASEAARLMATAEKHFPDTVPAFAIALFTGMRQREIERLEPGDVTREGITVPAASAKTKRRRFIQTPEPLAAWLAAYPIGETVTPPNWYRKEKAVRRLAGWKVWSDLVPTLDLKPQMPAEPPEDAPQWPGNALRHTAASVALAIGKPLEMLIFEHGHAGGVEMLRRHYIGRMPKAEALKIWSIAPAPKKGEKTKKVTHLKIA
jgi:integrase